MKSPQVDSIEAASKLTERQTAGLSENPLRLLSPEVNESSGDEIIKQRT